MDIALYILYKPIIHNFKNNYNKYIKLNQIICGNEWNWDSESELEIEEKRQSINNIKVYCGGIGDSNLNDGDW